MNQLDISLAVRYNIIVKQNQTFDPLFTFIDQDGNAINLSGSTVKLSVRQDNCYGDCGCNNDTFDLLYKQDFYGTVTGTSNNKVQFNEVVKLTDGFYQYDMLIEFASGGQQYYLAGTFRVKKSHTKI